MPSSSWRPTVQFSSPHPHCSPIPPLVVKTIGTKSILRCWHRSLYLSVFVLSADLVPAFGLRKDSPHAPAPEWLTADGFTMLTSKATLFSQKGLPQTYPSVCLPLPFAEMNTKLLSTEPVEPENFSSYLNQARPLALLGCACRRCHSTCNRESVCRS